jgi:DNA-binding transcriptional ArsR family regulator
MRDGPTIAKVAALIGDPARANMLVALMDGRALTVTELAEIAGVTLQTASGHLARLSEAALTSTASQGRHRYIRLAGPEVSQVLESLMSLAQHTGSVPVRTGPRDAALRTARICYDHLAGEHAVRFYDMLVEQQFVVDTQNVALTAAGRAYFMKLGIDVDALGRKRRQLCKPCLDWSERRSHLGGALGAALLNKLLERGIANRGPGRLVILHPEGLSALAG